MNTFTTEDTMTLLKGVVAKAVENKDYAELNDLVTDLPNDEQDAYRQFCDAYDLGEWFYDALVLNNFELTYELNELITDKKEENK